jgi:hypothetical protein
VRQPALPAEGVDRGGRDAQPAGDLADAEEVVGAAIDGPELRPACRTGAANQTRNAPKGPKALRLDSPTVPKLSEGSRILPDCPGGPPKPKVVGSNPASPARHSTLSAELIISFWQLLSGLDVLSSVKGLMLRSAPTARRLTVG